MNAVNLDEASELCQLVQEWKKYSTQLICLAFNSHMMKRQLFWYG